MWETSHSERSSATAAEVWALWADPERWPDWHPQIASAELDGELVAGGAARVKLRRGGRMRLEIVAVEPERLLVDEVRLPGARLGHERRLEPTANGIEITHRLYVRGPLSRLFALLQGRKRMRELVVEFSERERRLADRKPIAQKRRRR